MRLVDLLREYGLERSLKTLLANVRISFSSLYTHLYSTQGVNDLETLDEKRDEILNSSVG
jgi:hypothetical protein